MLIPASLQHGGQTFARLRHPLELVERENQFLVWMREAPLLRHRQQRVAPARGAQIGEQGHVQCPRSLDQKGPHLKGGRGLLPQMVDARLAFHELEDELALADTAAAVDWDERRFRRLECRRQPCQFTLSANELHHEKKPSNPRLKECVRHAPDFDKSCLDKSCLDKSCLDQRGRAASGFLPNRRTPCVRKAGRTASPRFIRSAGSRRRLGVGGRAPPRRVC